MTDIMTCFNTAQKIAKVFEKAFAGDMTAIRTARAEVFEGVTDSASMLRAMADIIAPPEKKALK